MSVSAASASTTSGLADNQVAFHIPSLDGIRAAAVLLVFFSHIGFRGSLPGNFGVTVFFFLSGYLITTLLRREFAATGLINLRAFYLRRVFRIMPPMYLFLAFAVLLTLTGALQGTVRGDALALQLVHLTNFRVIHSGWWEGLAPGTWIYWSLAVEEHFYLLFPLAYIVLLRLRASVWAQVSALLAVCAMVLAWRFVLVLVLNASEDRTYMATDTRIDSILFGCVLGIFNNPAFGENRISETTLKWLWSPLAIVVLLLSFGVADERFKETIRYTMQGIALFPLFILAISHPEWGPIRLLNLRIVAFVGILSYSAYLVHPTVIYAVEQHTSWSQYPQAGLALAITMTLAYAVYTVVEKPCAQLRRQLSGPGVVKKPEGATATDSRSSLSQPTQGHSLL